MKLGAILPIGSLRTFGYQYYPERIITNITNFADAVVILSSSRDNPPDLGLNNSKITYISSEESWFSHGDEGEVFSYAVLNRNVNHAVEILREQGCDIVFQIHINQYIPKFSQAGLYTYCQQLLQSGRPYGWLYKRYQLGKLLFNADVKVPWILNLTIDNPYTFSADEIEHKFTNEKVRIEVNNFAARNELAIVDILLNFTLEDARKLYEFTHQENLRISGRASEKPVFDYAEWHEYYRLKIAGKLVSRQKLDELGVFLAEHRPPDFLSRHFEATYAATGKFQRFVKRIRQGTIFV